MINRFRFGPVSFGLRLPKAEILRSEIDIRSFSRLSFFTSI
jgi:hypothetical protein